MSVYRPCQEEEYDAGQEVQAKWMNVAHAPAGVEVVGQLPRPDQKEAERLEKLCVPIEERVGGINQNAKERSPVVDRMLPAFSAELTG